MKICVLFLLVLCTFCNKLPIGEEEFNERGDFSPQVIDLSLYTAFTEAKGITLGSSPNLILGRNDEYESRMLLKFNFPDTTYEGLDQIKLVLYHNGNFHNDTVKFSLHLLTEEFEENEATWTKKTSQYLWEEQGGDFEVDSILFGEAKGDSLVLWFNYIELNMIQDAPGIILIPRDTGFVHFHSREGTASPKFQLIKNDATTVIPVGADCHIMVGPEPPLLGDWIGAGKPFRNFVKFNYDTLLEGSKALYAELKIKATEYFCMRDSIEIGVRELTEPFINFDTPSGPLIALKRFAVGDTIISIDIVRHAQRIIEHPDSNFGFYISITPENFDISRVKLAYHSHRMRIGYIVPPVER